MNMEQFIRKYKNFLKKNANSQRAKKEKAYLYSDLAHYGVSVWERRKFVSKYKKEINYLCKKEALSLVKRFWSMDFFEERSMALSILNVHIDKLNLGDMPLIEKLMRESKGWAFLDSLIIPIMPALITKDKKTYHYLKKWIKDNDFWVRRSALLAQLLLFRKGNGGRRPKGLYSSEGDKKLFFDLAKSQFDESWIDKVYKDKEEAKRARFFIRKAIGWTLREMSIKDPKSVFQFLKQEKHKMSGLSFREGSRKLPQGLQIKLKNL